MQIVSPSSTKAIGPPAAASGDTWPMHAPRVAPLNLPSVIRQTLSLNPRPMMLAVGASISCMPGPPRGPSYLITTTSPAFTLPSRIPAAADSSLSKITAGPRN